MFRFMAVVLLFGGHSPLVTDTEPLMQVGKELSNDHSCSKDIPPQPQLHPRHTRLYKLTEG
jgi:hypothetical protein